jgi:hypothetical protein
MSLANHNTYLESKNTICLSHLFDLGNFDTNKMAESMRKRACISEREVLTLALESSSSGKSSYFFNFLVT